jgi:type I restriction enzyme S subunit
MSKIDELIMKLCPDGVQTFKLGELEDQGLVKLGRGNVISKNDLINLPGHFPVYSSSALNNGLFGNYGNWMFDDERITWSIDGGGKFFYRTPHKYSVTNVCGWLNVIDKEVISTRYLYFAFTNIWSTRKYNYTVKAHPSVIREDYLIPLPPLEIQNKIVEILNTFKELEEKLEAELEAELEVRKKQYEYYRNSLHSFSDADDGAVTWVPLGEILNKVKSYTAIEKDQYMQAGTFPIINQGQEFIAGYSDNEELALPNGNYVVFGDHTRTIKYVEGRFIPGESGTLVFNVDDICRAKYLYYAFKNLNIPSRGYSRHWSVVRDLLIPVPSFEDQDAIIKVLDIFSSLAGELHIGIPAEIEVRRQQYEYYRNKLLTFKELKVS